jgi:TraG P-loop domain/Helicase HerA, central domain
VNAPVNHPPAAPETRSVPGARRGPFDPESLVVTSRAVQIGPVWAATVTVTGYPREVFGGWLAPMSTHPAMLDVSLHISPLDPVTAATRLRRRLARLESGRRSGAEHGRLADPMVEAATEDAYELADRVARGEGRLFSVTMTLTVHAPTREQLDAELAALRALTTSLLMVTRATTWRAWHGWVSGLPLGIDRVGGGRVMDTAALAAAFPFTSPDLPTPTNPTPTNPADAGGEGAAGGVLYGHNLGSQSLVFWDRFAADNYNAVILGRSGSGKSYLAKVELLRSLYRGVHAQVIDPEDEYLRLGTALGATIVRVGAPGARLNPFDVPIHLDPVTGVRTAAADALARRALFLHTFLSVARHTPPTGGGGPAAGGGLSSTERAVLDTAITRTYRGAGITEDPATWTHPVPLLADLHATLLTRATAHHAAPSDPTGESVAGAAASLATRLRPFVDGAYAGLFNGPTTTPPVGHLVVWSLRHLAEELKPAAMLLVLDAIWAAVTHPHDRRRRLITVDEAWLLLAHPGGAQFLLRAAKAGRKHWAGLTVITQDTADVLSSDLGRAVIANAATQILLRQAPQALDHVAATFGLSAGERGFLLSAERGEGLLTCGEHRAAFSATASTVEDQLITTDPRQLAATTDAGPDWIVLDHPTHRSRPSWVANSRPARSAGNDDTQEIW